ncbi:MAG: DUF2914 domain-containing protein [bacterium]|nr:DUF2914 domain-containing protein [bacterium]MDZ4284616.1 DUF2914 domain-containing protein [Patescibacteria group bacterium]
MKSFFGTLARRFSRATRFFSAHFSTLALLAGFVWDNLTLTRVDLWLNHIGLLIYLALAGVGIILINASRASQPACLTRYAFWYPIAVQFAFGGLFSGYFVFYSRSGSLPASWPFLFFLAAILVSNEFLRERYHRLLLQVGILYIALFSYAIFAVPVVLRSVGTGVFLLSGLVSLAMAAFFLALLSLVLTERFRALVRRVAILIIAIYALFNAFYFLNVIPPLPLSLKDIGVYHRVEKTDGGGYRVLAEAPRRAWLPWPRHDRTLYLAPGGTLYCFSSVFAPTAITTRIFHSWEYKDARTGKWAQATRVPFSITGGRDGGYRGFSFKSALFPGHWRCDVETERGALIGRRTFRIVETDTLPKLVEREE